MRRYRTGGDRDDKEYEDLRKSNFPLIIWFISDALRRETRGVDMKVRRHRGMWFTGRDHDESMTASRDFRTIPLHDVIILLSVSRRKTSYDLLAEKKGDMRYWGMELTAAAPCRMFTAFPSKADLPIFCPLMQSRKLTIIKIPLRLPSIRKKNSSVSSSGNPSRRFFNFRVQSQQEP